MADSRILHRSAGDSEKVAALSDLEYRVWTQYVLAADDYGVMPASAFVVQAHNRNLRQRPTKAIQKALETVIACGLVLTFNHQGERYVWQSDWNDWQQIRHPRATVWPLPSNYSVATERTRELFDKHPTIDRSGLRNISETDQTPAGAHRRETLTPTQTPAPPGELERGVGKTKQHAYPEEFETAWRVYPRKTGKGEAAAAWKKHQPPIDAVIAALSWQIRQPQWTKDRGDFIPHMSTWLNRRGWEDEPFHVPDPTDEAFAVVQDLFQRKAGAR